MKIGLVGCGAIGEFLLNTLNVDESFSEYEITAVFDARKKSTIKLKDRAMKYKFDIFQDLDAFLHSDIDIVVECANIEVVNEYATRIINRKI